MKTDIIDEGGIRYKVDAFLDAIANALMDYEEHSDKITGMFIASKGEKSVGSFRGNVEEMSNLITSYMLQDDYVRNSVILAVLKYENYEHEEHEGRTGKE